MKHSRQAAFWLVAYVYVVGMLGTTLPTPLYVLYASRWHFSAGIITVIFACYPAGVLSALLLLGRVSDQLGRRPMLLEAIGLAAASTALFLTAQGVGSLLAARLLSGLGSGVFMGTATAAMTELRPPGEAAKATWISTAANVGGLGLGPLLSGLLAQYGPSPTSLVFVVYLALLVPAVLGLWLVPETVVPPAEGISWRPRRPHVPRDMRGPFTVAGIAVFCIMGMAATFTSLAPSFLRGAIHMHNLAVAGAIVCLLFGASAVVQLAAQRAGYRRTMGGGFAIIFVALALIALAVAVRSFLLFALAAGCTGLAYGLAFMGSLQLVNVRAPEDHRAEVVSAYFVVAYVGAALPQLGLGIGITRVGFLNPTVIFAAVIGALTLVAAAALHRERDTSSAVSVERRAEASTPTCTSGRT